VVATLLDIFQAMNRTLYFEISPHIPKGWFALQFARLHSKRHNDFLACVPDEFGITPATYHRAFKLFMAGDAHLGSYYDRYPS